MTFLMIKNESANPVGISLLGANTIVLESDDCSDFIPAVGDCAGEWGSVNWWQVRHISDFALGKQAK
jgi:hypothetical protein